MGTEEERQEAPPPAEPLEALPGPGPDPGKVRPMLTAASLGMAIYGLQSCVSGVVDLVGTTELEVYVSAGRILLGLVLVLAAAFVRLVFPGGLALAVSALLGLQALAIHASSTLYGEVPLAPQAVRAVIALTLVALAYFGGYRHTIWSRR
jgi:hypothetical protein